MEVLYVHILNDTGSTLEGDLNKGQLGKRHDLKKFNILKEAIVAVALISHFKNLQTLPKISL